MGAKEKNEIRILVVDDEVEIADTFRDIFQMRVMRQPRLTVAGRR